MSVTNQPRGEAYIGASGSGKGVSINRRLRELQPQRLLVWDPRDEYGAHAHRFNNLQALVAAWRKAGSGPIRARYVCGSALPMAAAFGIVCTLAFEAGNLVFVAEELSDVTSASQAPPAWRRVMTQGRHRALHVIGAAQRPALIDKTFLGNCTAIRCFTLRYREDRRAMAAALDVDEGQVAELATVESATATRIGFIDRDFRTGVLRTDNIVLKRRA